MLKNPVRLAKGLRADQGLKLEMAREGCEQSGGVTGHWTCLFYFVFGCLLSSVAIELKKHPYTAVFGSFLGEMMRNVWPPLPRIQLLQVSFLSKIEQDSSKLSNFLFIATPRLILSKIELCCFSETSP